MNSRYSKILLTFGLLFPFSAYSADKEIVLDNADSVEMEISIYNNSLGFVRDTREAGLEAGYNSVAFAGVASQIKPETVMVETPGAEIVEQNYNYNLLTPVNIVNESVGQTVKTAVYNEATGQTVFDSAKIIDSNYGNPVLQFSYGIETHFPGRLIFDKLPENLVSKPTLEVRLNNKDAGRKKIELAYLTNGISWKADYVAEIKSAGVLDLNGWITLSNDSGADYKNASVQLIAGNVNQVSEAAPVRPLMLARAMKANAESASMDAAGGAYPANEAFADYYLYTLPVKTTIKNQQSKQVSLFVRNGVRFEKEYRMISPLYVGINVSENEFQKQNPQVVFKLDNAAASGLGLPMPQGVIRFYEKDSGSNLQFIGESSIPQLADGEKADLMLGKAFDIFAKGRVLNVNKVSKDIFEADVEVAFNNAKTEEAVVNFEQNFNNNWEILSESQKSERKNANTAKWQLKLPAKGAFSLTYKVRITRK